MKEHKFIIKFNKSVIQERKDNNKLILKPAVLKDSFLNNFNYYSIVDDDLITMKNQLINCQNLTGICYIEEADNMPLEELQRLVDKINSHDCVEYAYIEHTDTPPPFRPLSDHKPGQIYNTPNFNPLQGYQGGTTTDHIGIDIEYAWSLGITGQGIRCADIEGGFDFNHVNLQRKSFINLSPEYPFKNEHGTAVAGIMYAKDMGLGIKGLVHGADIFYGVSEAPAGRVNGIAKALKYLRPGDIFIYELQSMGPRNKYVPADYQKAVWDITKAATDAGIIVIMAAGNGAEDLDHKLYNEYRNRNDDGDNGAIRVGAGDKKYLIPTDFTTYGSMIHVQGWGLNVVTTGYNDLYDSGEHNNYTHTFSGTSSATPIVASAVVAIQSWYKQHIGDVIKPKDMRALLIETGTPQGFHQTSNRWLNIGPLPNVRRAINTLKRRLQ
ncbi:S8 family serine peptidase [Arsenophonus nasoniae]|uniref:S8 family serine peptidase n=1 Tax=Arsenophonus nasoniae TaxID=638 RepID=A0AA95K5W1_9GAMM|nr:S8 family serine peptidase [Arsenophonus nasoniae]WGM00787.1 S8 family serine peptidase [Arsenophonus nasoniae]